MPSKTKKTAGTSILAIVIAIAIYAAQHFGWINPSSKPTNAPGTAPGPRETASHPSPTLNRNPKSTDTKADQNEAPDQSTQKQTDANGTHFITKLQSQGKTRTPVTGSGTIITLLPDDNEGSRHQRFLVKLSDGHVIKIAHNIDLAPRLDDARKGDTLFFKGDFESNDLGGAVHWTHRDPGNRHTHGYLELNGQRYE